MSAVFSRQFIFQSTPPRRRRPFFSCLVASINFFNPRLREGGDNAGSGFLNIFKFSIHASAKEATFTQGKCIRSLMIFSIHASAKEATGVGFKNEMPKVFSIHASAKEATGISKYQEWLTQFSIHASAKEATSTHAVCTD